MPLPAYDPSMETRRTKLLLIDDNEGFCDLARTWLEPRYDLVVATSARAGLEALQKALPDLLILDVMMPEISGLELFSRLRNDPAYQSLPVLFLTAYHQVLAGQDEQVFANSRVLLKPFRFHELQEQIEQMLADQDGPRTDGIA